jgi:hypothetical protein
MKCKTYRQIPYFESTVCERYSPGWATLLSAPAIAKLGFVHGLIYDAR